MKKAVFLDRDGVINKTIIKMGKPRAPYTLDEFAYVEGVQEAVTLLKEHGFVLVVVTNQPDVARGWVSREQVDLVNDLVMKELKVDALKSCFHTEKDQCQCRKPRPGMLLEAASELDVDLSKSFMVGDRSSDIKAGQAVGCISILVGEGEADTGELKPDYRCENLLQASKWLLNI